MFQKETKFRENYTILNKVCYDYSPKKICKADNGPAEHSDCSQVLTLEADVYSKFLDYKQ